MHFSKFAQGTTNLDPRFRAHSCDSVEAYFAGEMRMIAETSLMGGFEVRCIFIFFKMSELAGGQDRTASRSLEECATSFSSDICSTKLAAST